MVECEECGKKLGIFEGYRHPTMGKKYQLCDPCYDQVNESVARWQAFIRENAFNNGTSKKDYAINWKDYAPSFKQPRNIIENVRAETDILMKHK